MEIKLDPNSKTFSNKVAEVIRASVRKEPKLKPIRDEDRLIIGYTRHSTESQETSTERQVSIIDPYCMEKYGRKPVYFHDHAAKGTIEDTPAWVEALATAKRNPGCIVVFSDISRSCREQSVYHSRVRDLTRAGGQLKLVRDDTDNPLLLGLLAAMAEHDHKTISTNMRDGRERAARNGKKMGGHVPYGYLKTIDGDLEINKEQAEVIRHMYRMKLSGASYRVIAAYLNNPDAPIATPSGKGLWNRTYIPRLLRSPIYCGVVVNKRTTFKWEKPKH